MTQQCEKKKTGLTDMETRQHRYAFRKAMSNGLQKAFQPVTGRTMPEDFMALLEEADRKRA